MTDLEKMRQSIAQLRQEVERIKPPRIPEQMLESTRDCIGEFMRIIVEHAHLIVGKKRMIMNQETLEQAAEEYVMGNSASYVECFMDGANWRINSVWHDAGTEFPDSRRDILVLFRGGGCEITDSGTRFDLWAAVSRWAYVADLVPEGKEGGR